MNDSPTSSYDYRQLYRRKLPHIHSPGATLFITFRLADSIPRKVIQSWLAEKTSVFKDTITSEEKLEFRRRWFARFEEILDRAGSGPTWLADPKVAKIVADAFHYRNERVFDLYAYCIMSTHVHTVFRPMLNDRSIYEVPGACPPRFESSQPPLDVIMKSLKGYSARQANKLLKRSGRFWEEESYDHEVRDQAEFRRIVRYVLNNPVKAGLVSRWSDWKWSYIDPEVQQALGL